MTQVEERQERLKKLAMYLELKFSEFQDKRIRQGHRRPSQNEFIVWLGVEQSSFSNWKNGVRPPSTDAIDTLAGKLGMEVYEIMGVSPRLPGDKFMRTIAPRWHLLTDQKKREYAERILNDTDPGSNKDLDPQTSL